MNTSFPEAYFVDGGTLRATTPSYVKRPADDELFEALMNREYCYILTPRQMGKSSLMIRTSQKLKEQNIKTAAVDIQGIGTNRVKEWYASLLSQIRRGLRLSVDIDEWMQKKSNVGFGQLFMDFIQDIVLVEISEQVVIFLDEVDWMIKIDFRDDFFASVRSIYNTRAQYSEFNRISFVLLGVASPADLISEPTRTPFNIGHSISLQELSLEDAEPLQNGLEQTCPGEGKRILDRIFYWTSGHPYLTQKLCKTIAETEKADWPDSDVDDLVHRLFLAEESRKEANLKFIQDRILSNEHFAQMLKLYRRVRHNKVKENGQSITQNQLMLSGLLTGRNGYLEIRNRIYQTVFNERWINRNMPRNWQRAALIAMSSLVVLVFAALGYNYTVSLRLKTYQTDYIRGGPEDKIRALANIYGLRYLFFSNTDIDATGAQAFYEFSGDSKAQLSIFPSYGVHDHVAQKDLVTVVGKLYVTLANVDEDNDNTSLLQAMTSALHQSNTGGALQRELDAWISGRTGYKNKDYVAALQGYTDAINTNSGNQATLYERAKVYIALKQYDNALQDLDAAIAAAKQSAPDVPPSPTPTNSPTPPSDTPAPLVTDTPKPNATNQISNTQSVGNENTPTIEAVTPTPDETATSVLLTPSPTAAPPQPVVITPDKFESNFTTLNHVIVAVKALVDGNPNLQGVLLSSTNSPSNLGFIVTAYAQRPPAKPSSQVPIPVLGNLGGADKIALVANNEIWLMNVNGSDLKQLTTDGATKSDLQWLPDGNTIIFISGKTIKFYDITTDTVDTLASFASEASVDAFRVSNDGKQAMLALSNEIFVVPFSFNDLKGMTNRGQLLNLSGDCILPTPKTPAALQVREARWSVDDKLVAWMYLSNDPTNPSVQAEQVGVFDITSCQPETVNLKDNFPGTRFTPAGYQSREIPDFDWDGMDQFVFNTSRRNAGWGELYIYNWRTHKPTQIFAGTCCYRDARFSPDGTYILYEFQNLADGAGAQTQFFYVPVGELNTGASFQPVPLPAGFFKNPKEGAQAALRSVQSNSSSIVGNPTLILTQQLISTSTPEFVLYPPPSINLTRPSNLSQATTYGIGSTIISNEDSMTLIYVPAGDFTMGSDNGYPEEKPIHKVTLDAFWIDRTEVTNKMYTLCVAAGVCQSPIQPNSANRINYYGNSHFDDYPVIYVDWNMAKAYCEWAGRRLPTEAEWEKAASWDQQKQTKYIYPWGNEPPNNSLLNYNKVVGDTTEVGKYPDGASPYGVLDMAGNVWDWVADWYSDTYYSSSSVTNPLGPTSGRYHVLRGGSWVYGDDLVRSAYRGGNFPAYALYSIGFRCARSETP